MTWDDAWAAMDTLAPGDHVRRCSGERWQVRAKMPDDLRIVVRRWFSHKRRHSYEVLGQEDFVTGLFTVEVGAKSRRPASSSRAQ